MAEALTPGRLFHVMVDSPHVLLAAVSTSTRHPLAEFAYS
jgi:hypothetical protein